MSHFIVKKVAVLGAGVMGAQIAAHCVNAKVPVILFDLPAKEGSKNGIAEKAIANLKKLSPAPLGTPELADLIQPANYEEHLELLKGCDVVIEAIAERMDWKHDLYKKVTPFIGENAIFATNTSGLSITKLSDGFEGELKARFCGVHFFNPPRYMHLVELIPTATTRADILDQLEVFLTSTLGKGVVRAKDTPNFIANRVGIFGILATFAEAQKFGLSVDVVDDLTGEKLGRAKSATFRTADVVGLDTMGHVIKTMQDNLPASVDSFAAHFATPEPLARLIAAGALGQKTGAGFYKKVGKEIQRLDFATGGYVAGGGKADETVARILKKKDPAERLKLLRESDNKQAQFVWSILRDTFHYCAIHLESIADNARDVDFAMRFGFGNKLGPFELWQAAGWKQVAEWIKEDIAAGKALSSQPLPAWVFEVDGVHTPAGSWSVTKKAYVPASELPVYRRQVFRAPVLGQTTIDPKTAGNTVFENEEARLWTLAEDGLADVLILSLRGKMNTLGPGATEAIFKGVALAEASYKGIVVWSPTSLDGGAFSAGANLEAMLPTFMKGGAKAIEPEEKKLQDAMLAMRYANVPTVAALSGLALGGGCELAVYCNRRVANLETYIGLVEVGVGLIPGAGGLTYGARRAAEEWSAAPAATPVPLLPFVTKYFLNAGMANVAKSALEARSMGYLLWSDKVVFNPYELLYVAVREAKAMHDAGYRPPMKQLFPVAGRAGVATIMAQLTNMRDGGFISAHDFHLGKTIAEVMCGGDVEAGSMVSEEYLMTLERKAFCGLLTHPKTQERIMGMLQTGKPVRN
ncbi:3-hydroxyacyl-CoA dehydrogenase/enoyl-CoA hydratase family protein [Piscinibacterium candidicorallinum]|uniref:3-hydroxyacyl-CoA dehydrogenase/enoyl-CoA hydratase family protein n=1 Tax=Piscinibacterium candidicorallinum TaxID=1793872 RepID=A0ABV7H4U1_9BURK